MQFIWEGITYHWFIHAAENYYDTGLRRLCLPGRDPFLHLEETVRALVCCCELYGDNEGMDRFYCDTFFADCPAGFTGEEEVVSYRLSDGLLEVYTSDDRIYKATEEEWSRFLVYDVPHGAGYDGPYQFGGVASLPPGAELYLESFTFPPLFISEAQFRHYSRQAEAAVKEVSAKWLGGQCFYAWAKENA